jgi:hypothetical protein
MINVRLNDKAVGRTKHVKTQSMISLLCAVLFNCYIMFVKLCWSNYPGDGVPIILSSRVMCYPALLWTLYSVQRPNNRKTLAQCFIQKSWRPELNNVVCPSTELCFCIWSASAEFRNAVELHLSGLLGTASHSDKQKIRIIGFFFWK